MSNSPSPLKTLAEIEHLFGERGGSMYAGEPVTQTEHALQCAMLAEQEDGSSAMITAALLHDIGHLLHGHDEDCAEQGIDDHHEALGMRWLSPRFGPEVCDPVGMHVMAKRYRCAVDAAYHGRLSAASQKSLRLQGGPLSPAAVERFRRQPQVTRDCPNPRRLQGPIVLRPPVVGVDDLARHVTRAGVRVPAGGQRRVVGEAVFF